MRNSTAVTIPLFVCVSLCCMLVQAAALESSVPLITPDVTVYSTKNPENAKDVAATIEVLDEKTIRQTQINSLYDIGRSVSNVSVQQSGFYQSINIRGIGGGGRNTGFSTRVGVYLDGVYVGQTLALDNPIINADQIEILKGPQGYLFGNNSNAGVINIISKQPSHESKASVKLGVGNYDYQQTMFTLNGEINPQMAGRLILSRETRDGYVINQFDGSDLKGFDNDAMRGMIKLQATDKLDLNLSVDYMNKTHSQFLAQALTGLFGQPIDAKNNQFNKINRNTTPKGEMQAGGIHLNADYYFANNSTLHSTSAYRYNKNTIVHDNDYSTIDLVRTEYNDQISQYTQELRLDSAPDQDLRYNVGLYLAREINRNNSKLILGRDTNTPVILPAIGFALPFDAIFRVNPNTTLPMRGTVTNDTAALFSSVDYKLNPKLVLHAGARASVEHKQLDLFMDGRQSALLNMAVINNDKQTQRNGFFSPMLGLSYHLDEQTQFYVTSARAYKSGGWNVEFMTQAQANDGYAYAPESITSIEVGVKTNTPTSALNLSVFRNEIKNYQVFQYANLAGTTFLQLRNAAEALTQGVELSTRNQLTDNIGLRTSLAYLDARYVSFPNGTSTGQDAKGTALPDAPRWSASITGTYSKHLESLAGQVTLAWQLYAQTQTISGLSTDSAINQLAGRTLQDASLTYAADSKKWQWSAWVKNLTDKQYPLAKSSDAFGNIYAIYAEPRLFGISGQYSF